MPETRFKELHKAATRIMKVLEPLTAQERKQVIEAALALVGGDGA